MDLIHFYSLASKMIVFVTGLVVGSLVRLLQ